MHQHNPSTTPTVASTSTPTSAHKLDPIAVLREELAAAAICHGVERVEDLTEALVTRVVQRLGGVQVYVPNQRSLERDRLVREVNRRFDGRNIRLLALEFGVSVRYIRRLLASDGATPSQKTLCK
ncbi:Mor transcription activator family protein [Comamonas aquatica]|uniref:Mor transcription activator family protein n=1 Tax=Comamonas aquatica TaxID=225991 RepID=UPI001EF1B689|nr:Mor transcription activator family protein [Comamonas aquatica]CAB5697632.1 Uncharacterized conserved protein [Comamonas aquatica]